MNQIQRSTSLGESSVASRVQTFMTQVYGWMTCGLLLTAFISWYAIRTPAVLGAILSSRYTFLGLIIAQLAVVLVLSGLVHKMSARLATALFMLYSALTGLTLTSIFLVYTYTSIATAFIVSAAMFGVMTAYGALTKRDLSKIGSLLFMALIGIVIASLVNFWLKSPGLMWAITYVGVVVFVGLTAYDTQKLRRMGQSIDMQDSSLLRRYSIVGALTLYLDFINLFMLLLRIFGARRQ